MSTQGKKNVYLCECGHAFVTVDRDTGVTPFMTSCIREGCRKMASSFFYKVPQEWMVNVRPVFEWYRPEDTSDMDAFTKEHVARGGLIIRSFSGS